WAGPAGSYNAMGQFVPSPVFDNSNPDFVKIDVDGLNNTPLIAGFPAAGTYAAFQASEYFTRKDRSEDWSGRLGVNWDVNEMLRLYASASRGFIAAGSSVGRITTFDDSVLEPSVAEAYELGFKSNLLDGSMRLNGALFWQETTD